MASNVWIDSVEYNHYCFDQNTCTGVNIHSTFWKAMNCLYNDEPDVSILDNVFATLTPLSYEYQTYDAQFYEAYCRHLLEVANAFAGGKGEYENKSVTIDIEQICDEGYQGTIDIVYLIDASSSVDSDEFEDMKNSIITSLNDLSSTDSIRYAIIQFSGTEQFEVTIPFTTDKSFVSRLSRAFSGGTDVYNAFENLKTYLNGIGNISQNLKIVLFTDAEFYQFYPSQSSDYTPYNDIKSEPYNAEISVIRYT
ncbi:MAG: vWA domain-containing protein [Saprospiraceae bacterium]